MHLVATRNRAEIEKTSSTLLKTLEKQKEDEGNLFFVKGITAFFFNDYEKAKKEFKKTFQHPSTDPNQEGIAYMGLGFTNRSAGELDEAVNNLTAAIDRIESNSEFQPFIAYCYQSLGEIHTTISEYDLAIMYFNHAYKSTKTDDNKAAYFRYHMGLGGCYLKMKLYEEGEKHLAKALEVKNRPAPIISRVQNDLGVLYLETGAFEKAEKLLSSSLLTRESNGLEDASSTTMMALSEVYLAQNKIVEAEELLNRSKALVEKYQTKWKKIELLKLMAKTHAKLKNYDQSITYYEQYNLLYDEIKTEQERNILKFKNEQIEKQKKVISEKHEQLSATLEEIKRLKVNRKAVLFSWITIIVLVIISEMFLDPLIENNTYNVQLSLLAKVVIALLFKPIDGLYENILWKKSIKKVGNR